LNKEIIINAGRLENRVAILEDGELAELHVEREPGVAGSIYKGRITNVVTGMDAAFADIGLDRNGFLCVDDIILRREEQEVLGVPAPTSTRHLAINKLVHHNQEVLLQVVRAPMGTKGARVTTRIALPGRYLVLMLYTGGAYVGVSRKITDEKERARLRAIGEQLRPENHSLILRTESEGKGIREIRKDFNLLMALSERIMEKSKHVSAPALLHQEMALISKVIRDGLSREVTRVLVDDERVYQEVRELVEMMAPSLKKRIIHYSDPTPIFSALNIEPEIDRLLKRRVRLPSGGHLTIDATEALVAIDVNTGRYTGGADLEETIVHTNLEAAREIARQLRLRDLGGIVVLDFIDMEKAKHRQQVAEALEQAFKRDRAKIKMHPIGPLGLVEMTRKRTGESLTEILTDPCPYCSGTAVVKTPLTMAVHIERELARIARTAGGEAFLVWAHPKVTTILVGADAEYAASLSRDLGKPLYLRARDGHVEEYSIEALSLGKLAERITTPSVGDELEVQVVDQDPSQGAEALAMWNGYLVSVAAPGEITQPRVKVRVIEVSPSLARAELVEVSGAQEPAAKKRRRRKRRKAEEPVLELEPVTLAPVESEEIAVVPPRGEPETGEAEEETPAAKRRRRHRRRKPSEPEGQAPSEQEETVITLLPESPAEAPPAVEPEGEETPARKRRRRRRRKPGEPAAEPAVAAPLFAEEPVATAETSLPPAEMAAPPAETPAAKRRRRRRRHKAAVAAELEAAQAVVEAAHPSPEPAVGPPAEAAPEAGEPTAGKRRRHSRRRHPAGQESLPVAGENTARTLHPEPEQVPPQSGEPTPDGEAHRPRRRSRRRRSSPAVQPEGGSQPEATESIPPAQPPSTSEEIAPPETGRRWRWPRLRRGE